MIAWAHLNTGGKILLPLFAALIIAAMLYALYLNFRDKRRYEAASRYRLVTEEQFGGFWHAWIEEKYSPWDWELHYEIADDCGVYEGNTESDAAAQAQEWLAEQCAKERFKAQRHVHDTGCPG